MSPNVRSLLVTVFLLLAGPAAAAEYRLETWAEGLDLPWSIAFLPDGSALVTELGGQLKHVDASGSNHRLVENVPGVYFMGQGGLFDVVLHPDFPLNHLVYLSFAEGDENDNGIAVARGRLARDRLEDVEVIFSNFTRKDTPVHYGGRMAFLPDGSLLLTSGDGFDYRESAQDIDSGLGKVLRMTESGAAAPGNPFPGSPFVYSYGHRNPQGLAVSRSGVVWLHEHGPRGGDELNRIEPGANYGWPAVTFGLDYSGAIISPRTEWEGMVQPHHYWTPSIAPSGLAVYEAGLFPEWQGNVLVGALVSQEVRRLEISAGKVIGEEPVFSEIAARVRDVRIGPGGEIFVLTPDRVVRVTPAN